jgi:hypothetical protein
VTLILRKLLASSTSLVEHFRDEAAILIATEVATEGIKRQEVGSGAFAALPGPDGARRPFGCLPRGGAPANWRTADGPTCIQPTGQLSFSRQVNLHSADA